MAWYILSTVSMKRIPFLVVVMLVTGDGREGKGSSSCSQKKGVSMPEGIKLYRASMRLDGKFTSEKEAQIALRAIKAAHLRRNGTEIGKEALFLFVNNVMSLFIQKMKEREGALGAFFHLSEGIHLWVSPEIVKQRWSAVYKDMDQFKSYVDATEEVS
jgi:hypothetical protein